MSLFIPLSRVVDCVLTMCLAGGAQLRDRFVEYMRDQFGQLQQAAQQKVDQAEKAHVDFQAVCQPTTRGAVSECVCVGEKRERVI